MRSVELTAVGTISLPDSDGNERTLSEFWQDNPVVFVWLRHYG